MKNLGPEIIKAKKTLLEKGEKVKAGLWQGTDSFKNYDMLVLQNYNFSFYAINSEPLLVTTSGADREWVREHFEERVSGIPSNPGESYKNWPYHSNLEDDTRFKNEIFSHTYQERFWPKRANNRTDVPVIRYTYGDLKDLIDLLRKNPETRQAYLPIFFPEDTGAIYNQRVPCTLGYLFYLNSQGELCVNYYIRSCDMYRHFRNDIYFTNRLLNYVAEKALIKKIGVVNMYIANLHIFVNDIYAFNKKEKSL